MASFARVLFCLAIFLLLVGCLAALADAPASTPTLSEIAKAPDTTPPADSDIAKSPTKLAKPTDSESTKTTRVAQLLDATRSAGSRQAPAAESAVELMLRAGECDWNSDFAGSEAALRQVVDSYPGTPEAVEALTELAHAKIQKGDAAGGSALYQQALDSAPDAESQALADVARQLAAAMGAKDYVAAESLLQDAASDWRGGQLGEWALLSLADLRRDSMADLLGAIQYYQAAAAAYPDTPTADEAEVCIAECLDWTNTHQDEAIQAYRAAADHVASRWLRARAMCGLASALSEARDYATAYEVADQMLQEQEGTITGITQVLWRGVAAWELGYVDIAVGDAADFLETPAAQNGDWEIGIAYQILGRAAFKGRRFEEAEQYFTLRANATEDASVKADAIAGIASCRLAQDDLAGAVGCLKQAAEFAAEDGGAEDAALNNYYLAMAALYQEDMDIARSKFQLMETTGTGFPLAVAGAQGAASCLMAKGDFDGATSAYEDLAQEYTAYPEYCAEARYQIGDMLYRRARYQEALVQFNRILSEFSTTSWVTVATERIAEINAALVNEGGAAK